METQALFDPGFAPLVYNFYDNIEAINQVLMSVKAPHQRKFKYQMFTPKIIEIIENNIAFHLGCLMWAKYLKEELPDTEIENNPFFGIDLEKESLSEDMFCADIDYLINYFEKYNKDCKFYLGKDLNLESKWLDIAKTYKEFLLLNKSFVNTKITSDLILPNDIEKIMPETNQSNKELIDKSIKEKNLSILLN